MKRQGYFTPVFAILLVASVSSFAKDSRNIKVSHPAALGGTTITPGQYKLRWESQSAGSVVTLLKGKNVVATAHGQWVDRDVKYDQNSVLYDTGSGGSRTILEMRFAGSSRVLVFGDASSTAQGSGADSAPATESTPAPAGKSGTSGDKISRIRFVGKPAARQHAASPQSPDPIVGFQPNFKLPVFPATPEQLVRRPYSR